MKVRELIFSNDFILPLFLIQRNILGCITCLCLAAQPCLTLRNPMDCVACQAPLSMGFSRPEYWTGLPFPSVRDLPDPGIKLSSGMSPGLQVDSLRAKPYGEVPAV